MTTKPSAKQFLLVCKRLDQKKFQSSRALVRGGSGGSSLWAFRGNRVVNDLIMVLTTMVGDPMKEWEIERSRVVPTAKFGEDGECASE
jgi:hypothetical protein